jgi:hypothetical protein
MTITFRSFKVTVPLFASSASLSVSPPALAAFSKARVLEFGHITAVLV